MDGIRQSASNIEHPIYRTEPIRSQPFAQPEPTYSSVEFNINVLSLPQKFVIDKEIINEFLPEENRENRVWYYSHYMILEGTKFRKNILK